MYEGTLHLFQPIPGKPQFFFPAFKSRDDITVRNLQYQGCQIPTLIKWTSGSENLDGSEGGNEERINTYYIYGLNENGLEEVAEINAQQTGKEELDSIDFTQESIEVNNIDYPEIHGILNAYTKNDGILGDLTAKPYHTPYWSRREFALKVMCAFAGSAVIFRAMDPQGLLAWMQTVDILERLNITSAFAQDVLPPVEAATAVAGKWGLITFYNFAMFLAIATYFNRAMLNPSWWRKLPGEILESMKFWNWTRYGIMMNSLRTAGYAYGAVPGLVFAYLIPYAVEEFIKLEQRDRPGAGYDAVANIANTTAYHASAMWSSFYSNFASTGVICWLTWLTAKKYFVDNYYEMLRGELSRLKYYGKLTLGSILTVPAWVGFSSFYDLGKKVFEESVPKLIHEAMCLVTSSPTHCNFSNILTVTDEVDTSNKIANPNSNNAHVLYYQNSTTAQNSSWDYVGEVYGAFMMLYMAQLAFINAFPLADIIDIKADKITKLAVVSAVSAALIAGLGGFPMIWQALWLMQGLEMAMFGEYGSFVTELTGFFLLLMLTKGMWDKCCPSKEKTDYMEYAPLENSILLSNNGSPKTYGTNARENENDAETDSEENCAPVRQWGQAVKMNLSGCRDAMVTAWSKCCPKVPRLDLERGYADSSPDSSPPESPRL